MKPKRFAHRQLCEPTDANPRPHRTFTYPAPRDDDVYPLRAGNIIHVSPGLTVTVRPGGVLITSGTNQTQIAHAAAHEIKDLIEALATAVGMITVAATRALDT